LKQVTIKINATHINTIPSRAVIIPSAKSTANHKNRNGLQYTIVTEIHTIEKIMRNDYLFLLQMMQS